MRHHSWLTAAAKYRKAKHAKNTGPPKLHVEPETLEMFMASAEGAAACKLLAESEEKICLGFAEVRCYRVEVMLDGEGLKEGAGDINGNILSCRKIDAERAFELLDDFPIKNVLGRREHQRNLLLHICHALDRIADMAPKC